MRLRIRKGRGRETSYLIHLRIRVDDADFFMYCKLWSLCDVIRIQNGEGGATKMRGEGRGLSYYHYHNCIFKNLFRYSAAHESMIEIILTMTINT